MHTNSESPASNEGQDGDGESPAGGGCECQDGDSESPGSSEGKGQDDDSDGNDGCDQVCYTDILSLSCSSPLSGFALSPS